MWECGQITNNGPILREMATQLQKFLRVPILLLLADGTLALWLAIKALNLKGRNFQTHMVIGYHQRQLLPERPGERGRVKLVDLHCNTSKMAFVYLPTPKGGHDGIRMTVKSIMQKLPSLMCFWRESNVCKLKWKVAQRPAGLAPTYLNRALLPGRR